MPLPLQRQTAVSPTGIRGSASGKYHDYHCNGPVAAIGPPTLFLASAANRCILQDGSQQTTIKSPLANAISNRAQDPAGIRLFLQASRHFREIKSLLCILILLNINI